MKTFIAVPLFLAFCAYCVFGQTNTNAPVSTNVVDVTPKAPTNTPTGAVSVTDTNFIAAHLKWESSVGAWHDVGYAVMQGSNLYHMEKSVLSSNLVAEIVWEHKTNYCVLESHPVREVTRTYIIEETKRYAQ